MSARRSRVVVVTGASAGVGRAVVREFGKQHARVALIARDSGRLKAAKRDVEELGGTAKAFEADVANATKKKPPPGSNVNWAKLMSG